MLGIPGAEVFVGSPNRPNLVYRVVPKPDSAKATLSAMVSFIRDNFPGQCGIVYCLSRKAPPPPPFPVLTGQVSSLPSY
jgi:superfamily II DNA helicase RecQ